MQADNKSPDSTLAAPSVVADGSIRVDLGLLDRLMNLVGELVLSRNQIVQNLSQDADPSLAAAAQRLNIITTELQEGVMKTRMQPIGLLWEKYPRIVRDLSLALGKSVRLQTEGQETELDRTIIETIKDPFSSIVRHCIEQSIELPQKRLSLGKSETGLIQLRAFHEGGQANIEITDDGAGLECLKEKSADNGMDAVRSTLEKLGGSLDLRGNPDEGMSYRIKIPLTLAIIPALIITTGGERFAIPQVSLLELVRLESGEDNKEIEYIFNAPVYRLRGKLLPLVFLNDVMRLSARTDKTGTRRASNIVVLKAGEQQFGLVVDSINDTQDVVVKPLGKHLKGLSVFAGATIMGDGGVSLILDVFGLAQHARVLNTASDATSALSQASGTTTHTDAAARQTLLIFSLGKNHRLAMPLSSVGRLEKFKSSQVEREGHRQVVQYRGQIMPLLHLSGLLGLSTEESRSELPVVVYSTEGRNLGLVVGQVEDIIEEAITLQNQRQRPGILGSAVIQGRVTELLDVPALVQAAKL